MSKKIKELRAGRWNNDLWYWWLRSTQIRRVLITGRQGVAATVFSIFSLIVTVALYFLSTGHLPFTRFVLMAVASVVLIASAILGGIWALRTMSPITYSQTTIGGCTASETLQFIGLDIRDACKAFENQARPVSKPKTLSSKALFKAVGRLKTGFAKQHAVLLKITALLDLASRQLDIPLHRLRDLLLEYDPAVHRAHALKFVQNLELFSSEAKLNEEHSKNLLKDNAAITQRAEARIRTQTALLEFTALHPSILRMAAVHSTAQATQEYARAISKVARLTHEQTPDETGLWNFPCEERLADGIAALRFLACRQRTHSGFDLNQTCLNMVAIAQTQHKNLGLQWQALNELGKSINKEDGGKFSSDHTYRGKDCAAIRDLIGSLRDFWPLTVERIQKDRGRIVDSFKRMFDGWENSHANIRKTLLVTHGFSTTVREVIKRALPPPDTMGLNRREMPDLFVIGSGDAADVDSRLMVSALLETDPMDRRFHRIAAGDENTLSKLVETDMKVMVVLGAECFDRKGRVMHPWGLEKVEFIKSKLGHSTAFSVVVVAEGYKFHENLLSTPQAFRYHLDRIQLYEPELINVLITTDVIGRPPSYQPPLPHGERRKSRDAHIVRRSYELNGTVSRQFELELG